MNERIKELAVQAKLPDYLLEYGTELCVAPHLQRFAELIVRECADISLEQKKRVEEQETFNQYDYDWNRARIQQSQHIADKVKQHFGVEE